MHDAKMRAEMAAAFRAAKGFLWDGRFHRQGAQFICIALNRADRMGRIAPGVYGRVNKEVVERLGGHATVEGWLRSRDFIPEGPTIGRKLRIKIQAYRAAWLDALANEFEQEAANA